MSKITENALKSWRDLNKILPSLREDQVKELLDFEVMHNKRETVMRRLHERFSVLRAKRERAEMFKQEMPTLL